MEQERINNLVSWIRQNYRYSEVQLKEAALKGGSTEEEFNKALDVIKQQVSQMKYKGVFRRFLASFVDFFVFGLIFYLFWNFLGGEYRGGCHSFFSIGSGITINQEKSFYGLCGFSAQLYFITLSLYFIILEWKLGGTLGKLITGIRVRMINGGPIGFKESLVRNVLRFVDFLPFFYLLGAILIWTSKSKQRLGDRLAKTVVVSKK